MADSRNGTVVTFYSYSGGTGRTMALANVGWILAANGKRVLAVDWDLESPALHRYFAPFVSARLLSRTDGVIELIREYEWAADRTTDRDWQRLHSYARVNRYTSGLDWQFAGGGSLDFLSAGRHNNEYAATLAGRNWDDFYETKGGGQFFDAIRDEMKSSYDYILIDSRTGISEMADVCAFHLPDILVDCFTFGEQSIEGAAQVARITSHIYGNRNIRVLPILMRVDPADPAKMESGRLAARHRFEGFPAHLDEAERVRYWSASAVPYVPGYAYEETLATFVEPAGSTTGLLASYEVLTAYITEGAVRFMPPIDEDVRLATAARFQRHNMAADHDILLRYVPADHVWAEWITDVLESAGVQVHDLSVASRSKALDPRARVRMLTVMSDANAAREGRELPPPRSGERDPLAVYVADLAPAPRFSMSNSAFLAGRAEAEAIEDVLRLVGRPEAVVMVAAAVGLRFPAPPSLVGAPARNGDFVGREQILHRLRGMLRRPGAVGRPVGTAVVLRGIAGIGKTQIALEYAHRFRDAYDIVFWIDADSPAGIDTQLADLGVRIGIEPGKTTADSARTVLDALSRGDPYAHWLLILDNVTDDDTVTDVLPGGSGDILMTTRNPMMGDPRARVDVDVFDQEESTELLHRRIPAMTAEEAKRIADAVGDLPIAVATVAGMISESGQTTADFLRDLQEWESTRSSVPTRWDPSLRQLRERSPTAYRLLQLYSVMGPEISPDIAYCDALTAVLQSHDPSVADPIVRAALVQHIYQLALVTIDADRARDNASPRIRGTIVMHRVVQRVVRSKMSDEELTTARHQIHLVLAACRPGGGVDNERTWPSYEALWPHVDATAAMFCADESVRALVADRVRYFALRDEPGAALRVAGEVEAVWSKELVDPAPGVGDSTDQRVSQWRQLQVLRSQRAAVLRDQGRFTAARVVDSQVVGSLHGLLGGDHPHTLRSAAGLAADLRGLGQYDEALALAESTYTALRDLLGEHDPRTLAGLSDLAASVRLAGDPVRALHLNQAAYRGRLRTLPPDDPHTLQSAGNVGRDLRENGEFEESVTLLAGVAATYAGLWDRDTHSALTARTDLAVSLRSAGRAADAIDLLENTYERMTRLLGQTSPDTLACRVTRALNMEAVGEPSAGDELREALDAYRGLFGPTHPWTLAVGIDLAQSMWRRGDTEPARALAVSSATRLSAVLGLDHPITMAAQSNAAVMTAESGDLIRAHQLIKGSVVRALRIIGLQHPDTLCFMANQALIEMGLGLGEFETGVDALLTRLGSRIGASHPIASSFRDRVFLYRSVDIPPFR